MKNSHPFTFDFDNAKPESPTHREIRSIVLKSAAGSLCAQDIDRTRVPVELTVGELRQLFSRYIPEDWTLYAFSAEPCTKVHI